MNNSDILEIKKYPDPVLRKKCNAVLDITQEEIGLFIKMINTMRAYKGIGLAAPQVGLPIRVIVVDTGKGILRLANPAVVETKGEDKMEEGCLSVPGKNIEIVRASEIIVVGLDEKGKVVELKAKGLPARIIQHEIDHLDGKIIIDYAGFWKKIFG